ncbi:MAG: hypothetical protein QOF45_913 [Gaiellaceae bacterium]|nr:hypothetical protein [Gaiellaceae bacterium]
MMVSTDQLAALGGLIRGFVRFVRRLALVAVGAVVLLVVVLQRNGFTAAEAVLTDLFLAPPAVLLFFAQGVQELLSLPDRLSRLPGEGAERLAELSRLAGQARTTRAGACRCSCGGCAAPSARCGTSPASPCRSVSSRPHSWVWRPFRRSSACCSRRSS